MGLLNNFNSMTADEKAALGKSSTRLQDAGIHKVTIKAFYETNTDYPQTVIELVTEDGLDITYRDFQLASEWDDEAKKYKDEKIPNKYDAGYITNIGKAVFGKDFDLVKQLGKGATESTVTNKAGKVTPITEFPAMVGKTFAQGTFTEFTSEGTDKDSRKKGKVVYRNQAIDTRAVFTKDLVSIPEQQEGITEGKAHIAIAEKLKATFKHGQGFKDNKTVQQAIKLASGKGSTVTEDTTTDASEDNSNEEEVF